MWIFSIEKCPEKTSWPFSHRVGKLNPFTTIKNIKFTNFVVSMLSYLFCYQMKQKKNQRLITDLVNLTIKKRNLRWFQSLRGLNWNSSINFMISMWKLVFQAPIVSDKSHKTRDGVITSRPYCYVVERLSWKEVQVHVSTK